MPGINQNLPEKVYHYIKEHKLAQNKLTFNNFNKDLRVVINQTDNSQQNLRN